MIGMMSIAAIQQQQRHKKEKKERAALLAIIAGASGNASFLEVTEVLRTSKPNTAITDARDDNNYEVTYKTVLLNLNLVKSISEIHSWDYPEKMLRPFITHTVRLFDDKQMFIRIEPKKKGSKV